jgi:two-component system LytT family response regulator/two-component system response regulator LytT
MPGLDGMGVIRKLRESAEELPYFVLVTAYENYAIEAFKMEALDYLLKPVEKSRLDQTIQRAQRLYGDHRAAAEPFAISTRPKEQRTKILVKSAGRSFIVDAQDIVYATIDEGTITIVTSSVEGESNYKTIEELQSNLDPETFWRVHRSYLVNINRIREVIPWFKSSYQIRMDDKKHTEIPVSRVQTKRLRTLLKL